MTTVLVEGESDRRAVDVLAARLGALSADVVVMHGITNLRRHLGACTDGRDVLLLHDAAETAYVERVLVAAEAPVRRFVCEADLEDELVRAVGVPGVLRVVSAQGERAAYERLAQQPAQRGRGDAQRLRRWLGARSGHKISYAGHLAEAVPLDAVPAPLRDLVAALGSSAPG